MPHHRHAVAAQDETLDVFEIQRAGSPELGSRFRVSRFMGALPKKTVEKSLALAVVPSVASLFWVTSKILAEAVS
jgi:hypothetical protein